MAFDLKKWLTDEMGLTAEELKTVEPVLSTRVDRLAKRQTDFEAAQTELAAGNQTLDNQIREWAQLRAGDDAKRVELQNSIAELRGTNATLEQKLRSLATDVGIDPETVIPKAATVQTPVVEPVKQAPDPRYLTMDQFGPMSDLFLTIPAELQAIEREHFELTGERVDPRELVAEFKRRAVANKPADVRSIWREKFDIDNKVVAKTKATRDAELEAARTEGYTRARSEQAIPGAHAPGVNSPVFKMPSESKVQRPQPGTRVQAAASALETGKYRNGANRPDQTTH